MSYSLKCLDRLPAGLRIRRLLETIWSELTFPQSCPPGHFYSPIPDKAELERDKQSIFSSRCRNLPEIDLQETPQLTLLKRLGVRARDLEMPENPSPGKRYYSTNEYFASADASMLATILLEYTPRCYLEVGSGFSSALTLDIRDRYKMRGMECAFIEPSPMRLKALLTPADREEVKLFESRVQQVPDSVFQALGPGDILFIDGSHVVKAGSDVCDVIFRALPLLRPGVLIHFHDIWWPFQYNAEDVLRGRSWNEAYFLRALLANNARYRILLFGSWLERCCPVDWKAAFPSATGATASSLWLQKVG